MPDVQMLSELLPAGSIVLSGHQHQPASWHDRLGSAHCFNPSCDEQWSTPQFITLDLERKAAVLGEAEELVRLE